jgi:hypothetical protein
MRKYIESVANKVVHNMSPEDVSAKFSDEDLKKILYDKYKDIKGKSTADKIKNIFINVIKNKLGANTENKNK